MVDAETKATVQKLPMLSSKACPRDGEGAWPLPGRLFLWRPSQECAPTVAEWINRVKEEYRALIEYQRVNKEQGAPLRAPITWIA